MSRVGTELYTPNCVTPLLATVHASYFYDVCVLQVLGLARMLMSATAPVRLRVLIPAVENNIAGNAFRPGDVLRARNGGCNCFIHKGA